MRVANCILPLVLATTALMPGQDGAGRQPVSFQCAVDGAAVNGQTGEPVPRALIAVTAGGTGASASTDSGGKWSVAGAPCGPVQIVVSRPGFLPYVHGQQPGRPVTPLRLFEGFPMHDVKIELVPQAVVTGRVIDETGDPVQNVTVSAMLARVADGRFNMQPAATVNTNDIGEFRVAGLGKGRYVFCARRNGNGNPLGFGTQTALADACYPGPLEGGQSSTIDVAAGREARVDFNMIRVATVHVRGAVTGVPAGRGFGVTLLRRGEGPSFTRNLPGAVRPDGKFDIPGVPPGAYLLAGNFQEGPRHLYARVPVNAGQADIDDLAVTMQEGFSLTATVRIDSSADPAPALTQFPVSLRSVEPGLPGGQAKWAEDHGSVAFADLAPGEYRLVGNPPSPFYIRAATFGGQDLLRADAALSAGSAQVEIVLSDDGGSIEGDVVDDMGNPIGGGIIAVPRVGRPLTAFASPGGYFKVQNVEPGDYTVYAWDNPQEVAWADPDWMRIYTAKGVAVTVSARQTAQTKLTRIDAPGQ